MSFTNSPSSETRIVPGIGPIDSEVVFVGEAPGEQEEKSLLPFVGTSGKLLRSLMHQNMINPSKCYITNVIKERPPKNDITKFIDISNRKGPVLTQEYLAYENCLKEELSRCTNAKIIVAVGGVALYALCRLGAVSKRRGSILDSTLLPGKKVIPIIHPASALRNYLFTYFISFDLQKVREILDSPTIESFSPHYRILIKPSLDEAISYLHEVSSKPITGVDIEVTAQEVDCISFSINQPSGITSMCIPMISQGTEYFLAENETRLWILIAEILQNPSITKVFQNGSFDSNFLFDRYGIRCEGLIEDTMIAQGLLAADFPKGLDFITSIYTNQPYYKDDGKLWKTTILGPNADRWWTYNALDSAVLLDILPKQHKDLHKLGLFETYRSHCQLIPILNFMQTKGIAMDTEGLEKASLEASTSITQLKESLEKIAGFPLNPSSPKQVADYFYVRKGIKPYTKQGSVTTDEDALKRIAANGHIEASIMLQIRKLVKMKGTYYDVDLDSDNRMRSSFNPIGAYTGRLSSSKTIFGTGANMQNQPAIMKNMMLVDPGFVAYNVDIAGAENRLVANIGPVPAMKEAFDKGMDVHRLTASLIFDIPYEDVSNEPGSARNLGDGTKSQRFWGKKLNHSSNYGIGPAQLGLKLELPFSQAKRLLEIYHDRYPEVRFSYQAQIRQMLQKDRRVYNCFGRSCKFFDRIESCYEPAYAFPPQSTIADVINRNGLCYIWNNQDIFHHVQILLQIHDSIEFLIPNSVPWDEHSFILQSIKTSLEKPISWKANTFFLPVEFEMCYPTIGHSVKLKDFSADSLSNSYDSLLV
jgi:uracil-DNA glycosylase family 4